MKRYLAGLICTVAMVSSVFGADFEFALDSRAYAGALTLAPGDASNAPRLVTPLDRALLVIEQQIEAKRAADASRSPLQSFWEAKFWSSPLMKLIPIPLGSNRWEEDSYILPEYLTVSWRQSEYQLRLSDERARLLLDTDH